jgi:hypothetical protein
MSIDEVRAALRALTRRMVEGASYEELTATLDAIAAMPGADELRPEIAGRRLALLQVHHRDEAERARVLRDAGPDIDSVPLSERVSWIVGAGRDRAIVEPHLRPLLAEIRAAAEHGPDDAHAQHALWLASVYRDENRQGPEPREEPEEDEEADEEGEECETPWPENVEVGLEVARRLVVARRPFEEIVEALDAVLELPDGEQAAGLVANEKILMLVHCDRDDAEAERVLAEVAPVLATFTAQERAESLSPLLSGRRALTAKYAPALIVELEEELRRDPGNGEVADTLARLRSSLERARAGG